MESHWFMRDWKNNGRPLILWWGIWWWYWQSPFFSFLLALHVYGHWYISFFLFFPLSLYLFLSLLPEERLSQVEIFLVFLVGAVSLLKEIFMHAFFNMKEQNMHNPLFILIHIQFLHSFEAFLDDVYT